MRRRSAACSGAFEPLRLPVPGSIGTCLAARTGRSRGGRATYHRRVESAEGATSAIRGAGPHQALSAGRRVTTAALTHLTLDALLVELLDRIAEILHADTAAILLLDEEAGV